MSFCFIEDHRDAYPVQLMCSVLEVSPENNQRLIRSLRLYVPAETDFRYFLALSRTMLSESLAAVEAHRPTHRFRRSSKASLRNTARANS